MIVTGEVSPSEITFDMELVDGVSLLRQGTRPQKFVMREHLHGFSAHVLQKIKEDRDHHSYLMSVIKDKNFGSIPRAAQGHRLEDAIKTLLQNKLHRLRFDLTGLDGQKREGEIGSFELGDKRWVQPFSTVPRVEDLNGWNPQTDWYVGLPRKGFTGVDFVLARIRNGSDGGRTRKLDIFFIQATVSTPQKHGIKKSEEQDRIVETLQKKCGVTGRNTKIYATFLTPYTEAGSGGEKIEYDVSKCYHSRFQAITGQDPLVKVVSDRCKEIWGLSG